MTDAPYVLILKNGPIHSIDDYVGYQLQALSSRLRGELWVTGSFSECRKVGNFTVNVMKLEIEGSTREWLIRYLPRVLSRIRQLKAAGVQAVLITYDPFKNGLLGVIGKWVTGWPLVIEVNGAYSNPDNYADMKSGIQKKVRPLLFRAIAKFTLRQADGIRLLFPEQIQGYAKPRKKAVVRSFFDGIPLERFKSAPEEKFLLHVGYPYWRKGIDILLQAFARTRKEYPEWHLVLIGHLLQDQIKPVPDGVIVKKAMSNSDIASWIGKCGCYVLASRSEAMGRVLLEAAAAARPRIAAAVDGTYRVLEDGVDGYLFEKGNVEELTAKMKEIMGNADLRVRFGAAAAERASKDFSATKYCDYVTDLVQAVIKVQSQE